MPVPGRRKRKKGEEGRDRNAALLLLSFSFLMGAAAGLLLGRLSPGGEWGAAFWKAAGEGLTTPPLWLEIWSVCRWPAAVLLLSFLPLRGGTIPVLFFLRGGLLSYCVAALTGEAGVREVVGTGLVVGSACLLTVPVLFLLGTESLMQAAQEKGRRRGLLGRTALCLPLLAVAVLVGQALVPPLLSALLDG